MNYLCKGCRKVIAHGCVCWRGGGEGGGIMGTYTRACMCTYVCELMFMLRRTRVGSARVCVCVHMRVHVHMHVSLHL